MSPKNALIFRGLGESLPGKPSSGLKIPDWYRLAMKLQARRHH